MLSWVFLLSPLLVGVAGYQIASRVNRYRWMIHLLTTAGMIFIGPMAFLWMLDEYASAGVGFMFVPFFAVLTIALPGYLMLAVALWHSRKYPDPSVPTH